MATFDFADVILTALANAKQKELEEKRYNELIRQFDETQAFEKTKYEDEKAYRKEKDEIEQKRWEKTYKIEEDRSNREKIRLLNEVRDLFIRINPEFVNIMPSQYKNQVLTGRSIEESYDIPELYSGEGEAAMYLPKDTYGLIKDDRDFGLRNRELAIQERNAETMKGQLGIELQKLAEDRKRYNEQSKTLLGVNKYTGEVVTIPTNQETFVNVIKGISNPIFDIYDRNVYSFYPSDVPINYSNTFVRNFLADNFSNIMGLGVSEPDKKALSWLDQPLNITDNSAKGYYQNRGIRTNRDLLEIALGNKKYDDLMSILGTQTPQNDIPGNILKNISRRK